MHHITGTEPTAFSSLLRLITILFQLLFTHEFMIAVVPSPTSFPPPSLNSFLLINNFEICCLLAMGERGTQQERVECLERETASLRAENQTMLQQATTQQKNVKDAASQTKHSHVQVGLCLFCVYMRVLVSICIYMYSRLTWIH